MSNISCLICPTKYLGHCFMKNYGLCWDSNFTGCPGPYLAAAVLPAFWASVALTQSSLPMGRHSEATLLTQDPSPYLKRRKRMTLTKVDFLKVWLMCLLIYWGITSELKTALGYFIPDWDPSEDHSFTGFCKWSPSNFLPINSLGHSDHWKHDYC